MAIEDRSKEKYKSGHTPWDIGQHDFIWSKPEHRFWLAKPWISPAEPGIIRYGLNKTAFRLVCTDTSDVALEKAREKASGARVECRFILVDFLTVRYRAPHSASH